MTIHRIRAAARVLPFLFFAGIATAQNAPPPAQGQPSAAQAPTAQPLAPHAAPAPAAAFTPERLDQMLGQIALYPDQLVTNILMASTYPDQVIQAANWLKNVDNAALKGDSLVDALRPMPWDPSVKFLMPFPQIVQQLNDRADWTRDLGAAFTAQQPAVMAEVQHLRQLAFSCGKLQTTAQQTVTRQDSVIAITPTNPATVYVPVYNPTVVYGAWPYPAYAPYFYSWPAGFVLGGVGLGFDVGIGYSVGFGIVGRYWGWSQPNWRGGMVSVNIDRVADISNYSRSAASARYAGGNWQHGAGDPAGRTAAGTSAASGVRSGATHVARGASLSHAHSVGHTARARSAARSRAVHGGARAGASHGGGGHAAGGHAGGGHAGHPR